MIIQPTIINTGEQLPGTYKVTFVDYDGTVLKSSYVPTGTTASAPTVPTISNLTFQDWNDSLYITENKIIGAVRRTTDNKVYLYVTINNNIVKNPTINLIKYDTNLLTVYWGDGSTSTSSASGNVTLTKPTNYTNNNFIITIDTTGSFGLGQGTTSARLFNGGFNESITKVLLSTRVTNITDYAFRESYSLETINFTNSTNILAWTFYDCDSLKAAIVPSLNTEIKDNVFGNCYALSVVSMGSGVNKINNNSFVNCRNLEIVFIPEKVTSLGSSSFNNCNKFNFKKFPSSFSSTLIESLSLRMIFTSTDLTLPTSVTTIKAQAFQFNYFATGYILGPAVSTIENNVFDSNYNLKTISLPTSVTSIGSQDFNNCKKLSDIYVYNPTPPTIAADTFLGISKICKIHIRVSSLSAYQVATNWSSLVNYLVADLPDL